MTFERLSAQEIEDHIEASMSADPNAAIEFARFTSEQPEFTKVVGQIVGESSPHIAAWILTGAAIIYCMLSAKAEARDLERLVAS